MKYFLSIISIAIFLSISIVCSANAGRGCCSWHGGVSGCSSDGSIICRDGSYSPTCRCRPYNEKNTVNIPGKVTKSFENKEKIIKATKISDSDFCRTWLDYYKTAAMLKGDTENIAKAEAINQYDEAIDLWDNIKRKLNDSKIPYLDKSICVEKGCYVQEMIKNDAIWKNISEKINNTYNYIVTKYHQ